jgi:hypothetical protein
MSDLAIKAIIISAAIAVAIASRFIPSNTDKQLVEKAAEEVIKEEITQI